MFAWTSGDPGSNPGPGYKISLRLKTKCFPIIAILDPCTSYYYVITFSLLTLDICSLWKEHFVYFYFLLFSMCYVVKIYVLCKCSVTTVSNQTKMASWFYVNFM